jgi:hypothetical protein
VSAFTDYNIMKLYDYNLMDYPLSRLVSKLYSGWLQYVKDIGGVKALPPNERSINTSDLPFSLAANKEFPGRESSLQQPFMAAVCSTKHN